MIPMPNFLNYAGKRVVVSGCSSGICAATARLLCVDGGFMAGLAAGALSSGAADGKQAGRP